MLKIESGQFIDVVTVQEYDTAGQPQLKLTIEGNYELINLQNNVFELQTQMREMIDKQKEEDRLIAENAALKDLHDQYKVVYTIIKKADEANAEKCGGGG